MTSGQVSVGCTFIDWSIHWLSGVQQYYWGKVGGHAQLPGEKGWYDVSDNPLTDKHSHGHHKNHPRGSIETQGCIELLSSLESNNLTTFYPIPMAADDVATTLNIGVDEAKHNIEKYWPIIFDKQATDYANIWEQCYNHQIPIIYVKLTSPILYLNSIRIPTTTKTFNQNEKIEVSENLIETFFSYDLEKWGREYASVHHPWDKRELLALNIRPWANTSLLESKIDFDLPHMYVDAQDLWYNGRETMIRIMDYLNLVVDQESLEKWIPVYHQWQEMQFLHLSYCWNFDYIVDCIVNDRSHDLTRYNLTLTKEAIIQHALIYKHGLTLKSWGLIKFPDNTQDLHALLDPNVYHKVENLYNL